MKIKAQILMISLISVFFSCGATSKGINVNDTGATEQGLEMIAQANNSFALEIYTSLTDQEKTDNIFIAPYSIFTALSMTYEGAKAKTAQQMEMVLHLPEKTEVRCPNIARLYNVLNPEDKTYKLSTANALWAQKDFQFLEAYTDRVEQYYGARVSNLDFAGETEGSRQIINNWVEEQTNQKIKDLIPRGALNALTRLVLTNAIYFKGTWEKQFNEAETHQADFTTATGEKNKVMMMSLTGKEARFKYAANNEFQILELPYDKGILSMLIILPTGNINEFESSFTFDKLSAWQSKMYMQRVDVFIPRFKLKKKYSLVDCLKQLGMIAAFSDAADFSGMTGARDLSISEVIHQTYIEVNEEGTEAAGATGVIMEITSVRPQAPVFRADHPFIFIIKENSTGAILFLGRLGNPVQ